MPTKVARSPVADEINYGRRRPAQHSRDGPDRPDLGNAFQVDHTAGKVIIRSAGTASAIETSDRWWSAWLQPKIQHFQLAVADRHGARRLQPAAQSNAHPYTFDFCTSLFPVAHHDYAKQLSEGIGLLPTAKHRIIVPATTIGRFDEVAQINPGRMAGREDKLAGGY